MSPISATNPSPLYGRNVLVVEDDAELASVIASRLKQVTGQKVDVTHSLKAALKKLDDGIPPYNLAILDLMLPETEADLAEIRELEKKARSFRDQIIQLEQREDDSEAVEKLKGIRYERAIAIKKITELINPEGGTELIERWQGKHAGQIWSTPTLFLTAISGGAVKKKGLDAGVPTRWLVKPVSSKDLLDACTKLLGDI